MYQNPILEVQLLAFNFIFYAMEMKYTITGSLVMAAGELSPVELELIFSAVLIAFSYFGTAGMQ